MNILIPSLFRLHCIMGPSGVIPNLNLIDSLAEHAKIDIWSMIPSLVDELGEAPDILPKLKSSKFICASGGKTYTAIIILEYLDRACRFIFDTLTLVIIKDLLAQRLPLR